MEYLGGGRKTVISVPLRLDWPIRHLLHRKVTKEKSREDIKYYFSLPTVTSKENFIEKYHRLMKNLYFIFPLPFFTSNECFSHVNIQQLLSNLSHFVLFSQAHLKKTLKTKTIEKIYFIRFYWMSNTKVHFTLFKFFWSKTLKIQKLIFIYLFTLFTVDYSF